DLGQGGHLVAAQDPGRPAWVAHRAQRWALDPAGEARGGQRAAAGVPPGAVATVRLLVDVTRPLAAVVRIPEVFVRLPGGLGRLRARVRGHSGTRAIWTRAVRTPGTVGSSTGLRRSGDSATKG